MILGNLFAYLALLAEELTILLSWLTASTVSYTHLTLPTIYSV